MEKWGGGGCCLKIAAASRHTRCNCPLRPEAQLAPHARGITVTRIQRTRPHSKVAVAAAGGSDGLCQGGVASSSKRNEVALYAPQKTA
jgi:hypothetical protein